MKSVEERLAALEVAFEEVKKLRGIPGMKGDKGNPGCIDAAVDNARKALSKDLADTIAKVEADLANTIAKAEAVGRTDVGLLRKYSEDAQARVSQVFKEYVDRFHAALESEVTGIVVQTLADLKVTSGLDGQPIKYA